MNSVHRYKMQLTLCSRKWGPISVSREGYFAGLGLWTTSWYYFIICKQSIHNIFSKYAQDGLQINVYFKIFMFCSLASVCRLPEQLTVEQGV